MTKPTTAPGPVVRAEPPAGALDAPVELTNRATPAGPDPAPAPAATPAPAPAADPQTPTRTAATPPAPDTRAATNGEIRAMATTFDLGSDWANGLIDRGATEGEARAAALEALRTRAASGGPAARVIVTASHDAPEAVVTRMGEALYARANPRHALSEAARPYAYMTTLDVARQCLQMRGIAHTGLDPAATIVRALHTTSDFPEIFADTANRTLRAAYQAAPAVLKTLARQTTARDFRAKTSVQLGEAPTLEAVNEHGEYKYGTMAEAAESYRISTFGRIIGLSRRAIVNDDLGAFTDLAGKMGAAAADFESQFLVDLLESNPAMADTVALFHADHGNLSAAPDAPDETSLSEARLAMRKQTGLSGRRINVPPRYLLVPPDLETEAEKLLATIQPTRTTDVNPFGGKLDLLVEARLSDEQTWFVVGDPAAIEGLEYSYLAGEEGPQTDTRAGFEVDGVEVKVRLDFGAAFLDWRGWYRNDGGT